MNTLEEAHAEAAAERGADCAGGGPAQNTVRRGQLSFSSLGLPDVPLTLGAVGVGSLIPPLIPDSWIKLRSPGFMPDAFPH